MIKHIKKDHIHTASVYAFAILFAVSLSFFTKDPNDKKYGIIVDVTKQNKEEINYFFKKEAFNDLNLTSNAYVVYDVMDKKIIYSKNENTILPLASLTKVMTAITAISMYDKNKEIIIKGKNNYDLGLQKNQSWKLNELLKYTLIFSSNDGADIIASNLGGESTFVANMNKVATSLNLKMSFTNPAGLDLNGKIGGEGSALDVAQMMSVAYKMMPDVLDTTTHTRAKVLTSTGALTGIPNTNQDVNKFIGLEASKTGFTDMAGGNLALIVDITLGRPVVIVVLGSTKEERFKDAYKLYEALRKSVDR